MAAVVLGWKSMVLMAHSMGGAVATLVAGSMPSLVKSLILVEALGTASFYSVTYSSRSVASSIYSTSDFKAGYFYRLRRFIYLFFPGIEIRLSRAYWKRQPKVYPTPESAIAKLQENNSELAVNSAQVIVTRSLMKVEGNDSSSCFCVPTLLIRPILVRYFRPRSPLSSSPPLPPSPSHFFLKKMY